MPGPVRTRKSSPTPTWTCRRNWKRWKSSAAPSTSRASTWARARGSCPRAASPEAPSASSSRAATTCSSSACCSRTFPTPSAASRPPRGAPCSEIVPQIADEGLVLRHRAARARPKSRATGSPTSPVKLDRRRRQPGQDRQHGLGGHQGRVARARLPVGRRAPPPARGPSGALSGVEAGPPHCRRPRSSSNSAMRRASFSCSTGSGRPKRASASRAAARASPDRPLASRALAR
jgi:hypothetical protein